MIFYDSEKKEKQRQELKQIITDGKAKGLSLEEIKTNIERKNFNIMEMFGGWLHALKYLEVSEEEYESLGFWRFLV